MGVGLLVPLSGRGRRGRRTDPSYQGVVRERTSKDKYKTKRESDGRTKTRLDKVGPRSTLERQLFG